MKKLIILSILLIVGCNLLKEEDVYGCTLSDACNFNDNATIFDDTCEYSSCIFDLLIGTWKINQIITDFTPFDCSEIGAYTDTLNAENAESSEDINRLTLTLSFNADSTGEHSFIDDWHGETTSIGMWNIEGDTLVLSSLDENGESSPLDGMIIPNLTVSINTFSFTTCHINNEECDTDFLNMSGTFCTTNIFLKQ